MPRAHAALGGLHSMVGTSVSAFRKGRQDEEPGAKGLVNAGDGCSAPELEGASTMRRTSTRRRGTTVVGRTTIVPSYPQRFQTETEAAREFSALVLPFTAEDLSNASGRTTEAAKKWKSGKRFPNGTSLLNMGKTIPKVRDWIQAELGGPPIKADGPDMLSPVIAGLHAAAQLPGEQGAIARAMLARMNEEVQR